MEAATSQHTCYYRSGFDISVGHFPQVVFHGLQSVPPDHRNYFLTFRVSTVRVRARKTEQSSPPSWVRRDRRPAPSRPNVGCV